MVLKPLLVAALVIGAWSVPAAAQRPEALKKLEGRIERIESVRAIKRLQYAYGHYVELGLWNDFADLFAEDAVTNYQSGVRGKDAIRKLFFEQVGQGKLGLADGRIYPHILFQPVITLAPDGRTAKGRWRILAMLGGMGGSATWYSGVYENEYVLENGVWKISVIHSEPKVTAAYTAAGWKESGVHVPLHYTAASVTTPIASSGTQSSGGASLAERAARLSDQAEVTKLQNTYGYAVDRKQWDQAAELFAADGTLELGLQGVYVGKASIRRALDRLEPKGLDDHVYLQTLVSVAPDGHTAQARGVELAMSSGELQEGTFENTFLKRENGWKIQSVHFYPRMIVDAALGWAKSAKPAPGPSQDFPPDRPPTSSYEIYPKFSVAPFHFDNPVTGRPPQYPEGVSVVRSAAPASRNLAAHSNDVERNVATAEAFEAAENLIGAYAYYLDESPGDVASLFVGKVRRDTAPGYLAPDEKILVNQLLQPVIEVAPGGKSVKVRARVLDPGNTSTGSGYWTAGGFEGRIVLKDGAWRFETAGSPSGWSAAYPGGWARVP